MVSVIKNVIFVGINLKGKQLSDEYSSFDKQERIPQYFIDKFKIIVPEIDCYGQWLDDGGRDNAGL